MAKQGSAAPDKNLESRYRSPLEEIGSSRDEICTWSCSPQTADPPPGQPVKAGPAAARLPDSQTGPHNHRVGVNHFRRSPPPLLPRPAAAGQSEVSASPDSSPPRPALPCPVRGCGCGCGLRKKKFHGMRRRCLCSLIDGACGAPLFVSLSPFLHQVRQRARAAAPLAEARLPELYCVESQIIVN